MTPSFKLVPNPKKKFLENFPYIYHFMKKLLLVLLLFSNSVFSRGDTLRGRTSYYANKFHGRKTASGVRFDNSKLTCAHKTLPFGTSLKITNLFNGKYVIVVVNDRGPYIGKRIVDLSKRAFREIDDLRKGVIHVMVEIIYIKKDSVPYKFDSCK